MIQGLDKFKTHFAKYSGNYVLIGGVPTALLLDEAGQEARATRDLDIVLVVEALHADFGSAFWTFVKEGGYQVCQRSDGQPTFYRFAKPLAGYPAMLELFAGRDVGLGEPGDFPLTRLSLGEEISSLSALLLDGAYYQLLMANTRLFDGLPIADAHCLLPLKAKAWLDLSARRAAEAGVDGRDIKKHRNDVLRLSKLLAPSLRVTLPGSVAGDMSMFLEQVLPTVDANVLGAVGIRGSAERVLEQLKVIYCLSVPS